MLFKSDLGVRSIRGFEKNIRDLYFEPTTMVYENQIDTKSIKTRPKPESYDNAIII